jgi:hypothetical protein
MQELLSALAQNQLVLALLANMILVTVLVRNVSWFAGLGDIGRTVTSLVSSVAVVTALRLVGVEPASDLLGQIPVLIGVLLEALVTYFGGSAAFKIAKTQPGSEG